MISVWRTETAAYVIAFVFAIGLMMPATAQQGDLGTIERRYNEFVASGNYSLALVEAQKLEAAVKGRFGANHTNYAVALVDLADVYDAQGRYSEAEAFYKRALSIFEKMLGADHINVATTLNNLASMYRKQGRFGEAEGLYKRALTIRQRTLGADHPEVAQTLDNLANVYGNQGHYAEAEALYKRALAIRERSLGANHPNTADALNNLAVLYTDQGRYGEAEDLYKRAFSIYVKSIGSTNPKAAGLLNNLADLYRQEGRYSDAEEFFKRELAIFEMAFGTNHPNVAMVLSNLSNVYSLEGRYDEADGLLKRALAIYEKSQGTSPTNLANTIDSLASVYSDQGRRDEAEVLYKRALTLRQRTLGADHPDVAASLGNLGLLYDRQGRYADAEPLYKRSLAISEKALGPDHPNIAESLGNLAMLYYKQDRYGDAEPLYKRSLSIFEKALGPNHPDVAVSLNNLAMLYKIQGRYADGLPIVQRTIAQNSARKSVALGVLHGSENQKLIAPKEALNASYTVVQQSVSSAAGEAISKLAARFAAGTDELAQLVRKDQDLTAEADRLDKNIIAAVSKAPAERNVAMEDQIRKRINEIKSERDKLQDIFNQRFPDYVALSKPQPVSVAQTQALLADEEALVVFDFDTKSYAWVITKIDANWTELKVAAKDLDAEVKTLREGLTSVDDKPFDTALAYQIYQKTFGAIIDKIASKKRLSLITNGALTSLPPHLLITSDPTGRTLKDQAWLVRSFAVNVLPTVASLKVLRGTSATSSAAKPMIAFADPVFSKQAHVQAAQQFAMRSITSFYSGTQVDVTRLGEYLPQLPGTRAEVQAIGKTLKVDPSDIKLGLNASVTAVKQARLDQYRIVYFATHGLVSGELERFAKAKAEPALVLTIPDKPTDFDDGLLQASEIAQLKLNADWVVLSACNTAAEEKPGAEALSGLARAFFYAGGRSLIVSHWQVDDASTARLMLDTFQASKHDARITHAEALRQAMLEMIDDAKTEAEADPRLWAPFVVVGEPAKQR